jgi:hypothetical protein
MGSFFAKIGPFFVGSSAHQRSSMPMISWPASKIVLSGTWLRFGKTTLVSKTLPTNTFRTFPHSALLYLSSRLDLLIFPENPLVHFGRFGRFGSFSFAFLIPSCCVLWSAADAVFAATLEVFIIVELWEPKAALAAQAEAKRRRRRRARQTRDVVFTATFGCFFSRTQDGVLSESNCTSTQSRNVLQSDAPSARLVPCWDSM